jgi:hypothetical protein
MNRLAGVHARYITLDDLAGLTMGVTLVLHPHIDEGVHMQLKFPKSKKKRVREKWKRDTNNWGMRKVGRVLRIGDTMYASPLLYEELKKMWT